MRDRIRVMIVDDMSTSRALLTQALEAIGIRHVTTTADGQSALHAIDRSPVHLVISDYCMPGMNGLQLLAALRARPATAKIGFVLVSGQVDARLIRACHRLGIGKVLSKPVSPAALRHAMEECVGRL